MKITFQGFQIFPGSGITLTEFADHLASTSSATKEYSFADHQRLFLFEKNSDPEFYTGLLITAKDQKTFPELRKQSGKLTIKVSELAEGSRLMDFNFFVLNKKTFCGVYQHYFASCSPLRFGVFLRYFFWKPEKDRRIATKIGTLKAKKGMSADKAEARAKKLFKGALKFALFYKPEDFEKILKTMKEIKQFHFDISTVKAQQSVFSPDIPIKGVQERVTFEKPKSVAAITGAISGFVKAKKISRGKVLTIDPDGEVRSVHITKNVDGFGEFDFDDVTSDLEFDVEDFAKSPVVKNLLKTARSHRNLFC